MNSHENDSLIQPANSGGIDVATQEPTMPLGVGNFEDDMAHDPLASGAESQKRFSSGTILIVTVILVSIGGLFFMRTLAKRSYGQDENSEIDGKVKEFIDRMKQTGGVDGQDPNVTPIGGGTEIISVLTEDYRERQVPLEDVHKNPFIWDAAPKEDPESTVVEVTDDPEARRNARELEIRSAAEEFKVKMVLMGSNPMANLNDQIVRVGDPIVVQPDDIEFRVASIRPEFVKLVAEDPEFDLVVEVTVALQRD